MPTIYEHQDGYTSYIGGIQGAGRKCQTFTPTTTHIITVVGFRIGKEGTSVYAVNFDVYAVDLDGKPTGSSLSTGTLSSDFIAETYPENGLYEIGMTTNLGVTFDTSVQYAIVVGAPDAGGSDYIYFWGELSDVYAGGQRGYSANSGATWTMTSTRDYCFEEGGDLPPTSINFQLNIGDTFKTVTAAQVNIGDTFKPIIKGQVNIGDTWKSIF